MAREMEALKARIENSAQSNSTVNVQLSEAHSNVRILEEEKRSLSSKITSKEREIDELNEEIRKLRRQLEVGQQPHRSLINNLLCRTKSQMLRGSCRGCE